MYFTHPRKHLSTALPSGNLEQRMALRRLSIPIFTAGFATFSLIYCIQPLMPAFSRDFAVPPATAALSLSLTTGALALSLPFSEFMASRWPYKAVILWSIFISALLLVLAAASETWTMLIISRTILGVTISGVPALAMAYLHDNLDAKEAGVGMGIYISGTAFGGMGGRLLVGVIANYVGWHLALLVLGLMDFLVVGLLWWGLPSGYPVAHRPWSLRDQWRQYVELFHDRGLSRLFLVGFLLMGVFVTFYNYLSYRLMAVPFNLSQAQVGLLFSIYVIGVFSSMWMGYIGDRIGRRRILWVAFLLILIGLMLSFAHVLWLVLLGMILVTFGFFGGHSIASSWVGIRAQKRRVHGVSLYLLSFYAGSALMGSTGGLLFSHGGWHDLAWILSLLAAIGLVISWNLRHLIQK